MAGRKKGRQVRGDAEQLRLAQQALGIVTWTWDVATSRVQWYGDAATLMGLPHGGFAGSVDDYFAHLHPDDAAAARRAFSDCLKGHAPEYRALDRLIWADGSVHWIETYMRAACGQDGRANHVMGIAKDVSEHQAIDSARLRVEKQLAQVFEASPDYIVLARIDDGTLIAVNPAFERATGYAAHEVVGRTVSETRLWVIPGERERWVEDLRRHGQLHERPVLLRAKDGRILSGLMSASLIEHDGEARTVAIVHDISHAKSLERRAHQSERKFAALFDTSPIGLMVTRWPQRRVVEINEAALRLIGRDLDEALGAVSTDLVNVLNAKELDGMRARALAGEPILGEPLQFVRKDGKRVDAVVSASLVHLDGEPHFIISLLDVTQQRRVERERHAVDARYRSLFAAALDGMVIATPQLVLLDANPAACAMTGYTAEELAYQHVSLVFGPEELAARPLRDDAATRWETVERMLTRKDGSNLTIEIVSGPMPDGLVLAIMRDITERKHNEALLMNVARGVSAEVGSAFFRSLVERLARELQADFAFIGELVPPHNIEMRTLALLADGAIVAETEDLVEDSLAAAALAAGGTVVVEEGARERLADTPEVRARGIEAYVGTPLLGADGKPIGVLVVAHRSRIERGRLWASMIEIFGARAGAEIQRSRAEEKVREINETLEQVVQERTAELGEANRELESYNYSISHDLRQPLNAITGFAELLREHHESTAADERAREFAAEIETNALRMEQMIESLLSLARAARGTINRTAVDVQELVGSLLRDLDSRGTVTAQVAIGELPAVRGDAVLLRQVWANLIDNAIKYSRNNPAPRVEISGRRANGAVEYIVKDNGVGFDMQHAGRLFGLFQRLPSGSDFEGSGIGLATVERIVRRHGGRISAQAAPGQGATFRFVIPD